MLRIVRLGTKGTLVEGVDPEAALIRWSSFSRKDVSPLTDLACLCGLGVTAVPMRERGGGGPRGEKEIGGERSGEEEKTPPREGGETNLRPSDLS